nr:Chain B, repeat peptide 5 from GKAP [Homo sapiens]6TQ0_D Chain D, repeat peptide 5 from GKAP [Homo sapiens]6TQ0_F Chain F, repeat peptide 5 from GKAP [Homo sapiens]6TQ0_H Chain H, repeat peptide 5 from GKAP [Homo sapiens]6TQ0_J Chain J, repeat peptide 5 from GKAP [Homo sapiens]6TQ0_L Chain L, repeat peptide 5 from GKAP [Homo sapiens]6TQ0_N Chain N, repeat peptide 5 from GKAP [Homo sapiens]6TQ0_P Chain P, repeat peptide 5 from GKAP [Homo sapiens]
MPGCFRMR